LVLTFAPNQRGAFYLSDLALDFVAHDHATSERVTMLLLRRAGATEAEIRSMKLPDPGEWKRSWTVPSEMRSINLEIHRERARWAIRFYASRERVPNVPGRPDAER
jgi:hypothetical protein